MLSKLGSIPLGRLYGKLRNFGYKLGLVEFKIEDVDLSKVPQIKVSGYEYPHQHEEIEKEVREIHRRIDDVRSKYRPPIV